MTPGATDFRPCPLKRRRAGPTAVLRAVRGLEKTTSCQGLCQVQKSGAGEEKEKGRKQSGEGERLWLPAGGHCSPEKG